MLHWSHLIDSLLCVLAAPFTLVMSRYDALHAAAVIFGPLNLIALGIAAAWAAAPAADRKWLWFAALLPAISPAIISYGSAGVVHHHVAIVLIAIMTWGWAARIILGMTEGYAGLALGAWAGLGIWISPETVPLTTMAFGGLWLAWILLPRHRTIAQEIGVTGISFALVTVLALLVDPPMADTLNSGIFVREIDRLSIIFAGLSIAIGATGVGLWMAHPFCQTRNVRTAAALALGLDFCCGWLMYFKDSIFRSNMTLSDADWHAFFDNINEMLPLAAPIPIIQFLITGALAVLLGLAMTGYYRSLLLGYVTVCAIALLMMGKAHVRFAAYPEIAGALALPIALTLCTPVTSRWHPTMQSFTRLAIVLLFVQVPYLGMFQSLLPGAQAAPRMEPLQPCVATDAAAILSRYPGAVVLTDVNDSPELLYRTKILTVGSLYHRNTAGFLRLRAAWRTAPSETVPAEIDAAGITMVLTCRSPGRSTMLIDIQVATLNDQLRLGYPPPWLKQVAENTASGHVLYQVVRDVPRSGPDT